MPAGPTRNLVTGGAGFLGSHLVDRLMQAGEEVLCLDNTFTGRKANVRQWWEHPRFEFIRHDVTEPINLGNPDEFTIRQLAEQVRARINPELPLLEKPLPADDPRQRQPEIALAQRELGWAPSVSLEQGLEPTIAWFRELLGSGA